MDDDTVTLNLVMVNINAICNALFLIYIPIVNAAFTESVEESTAEARLNVLVNTLGHLFPIVLSANCFGSNLHPQFFTTAATPQCPVPRIRLLRFPWKGCL